MARVLAVKRLGALRPADALAQEEFDKIKDGDDVLVEVVRARNPRQHRLYWALMELLAQNIDGFNDKEQMSQAVKMEVGCVEPLMRLNGDIEWKPKSISFANMKQSEWEVFFEKVIHLAVSTLSVDNETLWNEIEEMIR